MKKKTLAFLLALCMILGLAACGSSQPAQGDSPDGAADADEQSAANTQDDARSPANADEQTPDNTTDSSSTESDYAYVTGKGSLIVGITEFEPVDYQDADGNWIGFDADMAKKFAEEELGVDVQFQLIEWDNKVFELDGKTIDVVWNGMTLTDEVLSSMECSNPYLKNAQVVVVKAADAEKYQTIDDVKSLSFAVESGSAGQEQAVENGLTFTEVTDQATALLEVASGTADAAIVDYLMAIAMTGEGTSYADLTCTVSLNEEHYGVGFRKGSDLAALLNDFFTVAYDNGTMRETAETYGIADALIAQ